MEPDYEYGRGYVYVLKAAEEGYRKIGCTSNPSRRITQISPALPFKVELEFLFMCAPGNEQRVESLLHDKFRAKWTNGEWFTLDDEDCDWLNQNPLPLPIAVSHAICYAQCCIGRHCDDHLLEELLGLS